MEHGSFLARLAGTVVLVLAGTLTGSRSAAQSIQISGPLAPELRSGDVLRHEFTDDGTFLVYQADRDTPGLHELYGVPADGSGPSVRLNAPLVAGRQLRGWSIGAGNLVVFVADPTTPGVFELSSVPADGSAAPTLLSFTPTFVFWLNPAGDYVYFRDSTAANKLQRVPIDGSALPSVVVTAPDIPLNVRFSPDGLTALLLLFGPGGSFQFRSIPADGSGPLVLVHQGASGNTLENVRFAPDGVHVVFEEWQIEGVFFPNFLFSAPLDGSSPSVQLNTTQQYGTFGYELDASSSQGRLVYQETGQVYSIAFDGTQRVLLTPPGWESDWESFFGEASPILDVRGPDVVFEAHTVAGRSLLRAPLDGSQAGVPLFAPSSLGGLLHPEILASGAVVYVASTSTTAGLYTVPLVGGTPLLLGEGAGSFLVHADEQRAVFSTLKALFVVPLDGSQTPLRLTKPLMPAGGTVSSYSFTADGLSVAYVADPLINDVDGVFRAPLDGLGPVVQYNEPIAGSATGGDVPEFQATTDGTKVVYRADEDEDESYDLFVAGTFGRGRARHLTAFPAGSPGARPGFVLAPGGARVVFQCVEQMLFSLRAASTTPGPASIELDSAEVEFPLPLLLTADGTRAVYRRVTSGSGAVELRSVPVDGSSPPLVLHPLAPGRTVIEVQLSPDSRFAVYRANAESSVVELFSVALDGSTPPARLHPPLGSGGWAFPYAISPDSRHVVFRSERVAGEGADCYSAPIDGSFAPARVNGALPAGRTVVQLAISPDGSAVFYTANAVGPNRFDLFRAPIDGRAPPIRRRSGEPRKHGAIPLTHVADGRFVQSDFRLTSDGAFVLFRLNTAPSSRHELFRVPSDGSSGQVKLSGPLVSGGSVASFALSPDESRIVYLANAISNDVFELFSVPLAGGTVVQLDPLPPFGDVSSFRIDARSQRVVFLADGITDEVRELFAAPLDGSAPAERLSGPLPTGGDVEPDYALLPGGRTLYRADQDTNDVLELFVSLEHTILPR